MKDHMISYTKVVDTSMNVLLDYTNVIKSFEIILNSKYRTGKNQRPKIQKQEEPETRKPSVTKGIIRQ